MTCEYCGQPMANTQGGVYCNGYNCPNSYGGTGMPVEVVAGRLVIRPRPDIGRILGFKLGTDAYTGRSAKGRARRN